LIDKITKIVETIKKECPDGCSGLSCSECPLNDTKDEFGYEICEMLAKIELLLPHTNHLRDSSARSNKQKLSRSALPTFKRYSDTPEKRPTMPMEGSIIDAFQTAHDNLRKRNE
jgi:hypothetical protein